MKTSGTSGNPLALGGCFVLNDERYTTKSYASLQSLVAIRNSDGAQVTVQIQDIVRGFASETTLKDVESMEANGEGALSKEDWEAAEKRHGKLSVLIEAEHSTRALAASIGEELGISASTIYRWRAKYVKSGKLADLAPHRPSGGRGKSRIDATADAILGEVIDEKFLTSQKLKPTQLMRDIKIRCKRAGVKVPHVNTVRRRIAAISEQKKVRARESKDASKKYTPAPGKYPGADYPNAVWQIDHTPADICVVDDVYRRNIGRCWITVAIDVFSRCIVGFYLSLDKPNAAAVGMCLVHAILPKDGWLAAHGIQAPWPIWGKPRKVLADNDKTFRCDMVTRAAKLHHFDLEWRPVRTPHWGAHIERLLNTCNQETHTLPGTTFSNPQDRGDYKPHEKAELSFAEYEKYIAEFICGIYHQDFHKGINRVPIRRYEMGILGDGVQIGVGLPEPEANPARLRLDFLPCKECTVQSNGVTWDNIPYYDPVLDPWIHAKDEKTGKKRKFICRRDPRDISVIWFLDPSKDAYFKVPYRNVEHPSINLWELREVRRQLTQEGHAEVNEELIFDTYERMQKIRDDAAQTTQAARKANQKKRVHKGKAVAEQAQVDASTSDKAKTGNGRPDRPTGAQMDGWDDQEVVQRFVEEVAR